jgi:hypothetical protein
MDKYPMKSENKRSMKGMPKESGHPSTVAKDEKVGSSDKNGIRFGYFSEHPDKSVVSPERK